MSENWRPVVGYEGLYEVSDLGRVRSLARSVAVRPNAAGTNGATLAVRERILRHSIAWSGHHRVSLHRDGKRAVRLIHQLVLESFVGPRPTGLHGCHNDGDPGNNRVTNLRWDTATANALDRTRHGRSKQANQTHCTPGHPFDELNTYRAPNGSRKCRKCRAEASARWQARRRSERGAA